MTTVLTDETKIKKGRLSRIEQETSISFNDEEKTAIVFTHNLALIRKLDKFCQERPDLYKLLKSDDYKYWGCKTYEIQKLINFRLPKVLTEEQKQAYSERAKKMREALKQKTDFKSI